MVSGHLITLRHDGEELRAECQPDDIDDEFVPSYLGLGDKLDSILATLAHDHIAQRAASLYRGLRVTRQDPWECLASFICSTNTSIPNIKLMIGKLSKRFGRKIIWRGKAYHTFPSPSDLAKASVGLLYACGLGYRSPHLLTAAKALASGMVELEELRRLTYQDAKGKMLEYAKEKLLPGVGPKVADCVLLFSLGKLESFPVDVWIRRIASRYYGHLLDRDLATKLGGKRWRFSSRGDYERLADAMRKHFGRYAGYAEAYLYHYARMQEGSRRITSSEPLL